LSPLLLLPKANGFEGEELLPKAKPALWEPEEEPSEEKPLPAVDKGKLGRDGVGAELVEAAVPPNAGIGLVAESALAPPELRNEKLKPLVVLAVEVPVLLLLVLLLLLLLRPELAAEDPPAPRKVVPKLVAPKEEVETEGAWVAVAAELAAASLFGAERTKAGELTIVLLRSTAGEESGAFAVRENPPLDDPGAPNEKPELGNPEAPLNSVCPPNAGLGSGFPLATAAASRAQSL